MTLLLSCADGTEFTVNRVNDDEGNSVIEAKTSEGYKSAGTAGMVCKENELVLTVSKSIIGSQKTINFKWIDNCDPSDVYSFYLHGDCAPYGRLNFVY